jgi:hypothetical protein
MHRLSAFLLLLAALSAHGMCPSTQSVCAAYDSTPLIFRGLVLEAIPVPPEPPTEITHPDGSKTMLQTVSPDPADRVRMRVLEVFKGNPGSEITVVGSDQIFHNGGEFLVYASAAGKQNLPGTYCSRTQRLGDPGTAGDLAWLRAYPTAPSTVSIFGSVIMGYGTTDIPPVSVTLAGPATTRTVSSADDNTYSFKYLPPGAYTVSAVLPAGYTTLDKDTATVTVVAKSCAEVDWPIRHDTHIRGTVTDSAGNPAANAHIGLLSPSDSRTGYDVVAWRRTDTAGHFDFSKADPGDYWIALNYDGPDNDQPYVPVYYPSGSSQSTAELTPSRSC